MNAEVFGAGGRQVVVRLGHPRTIAQQLEQNKNAVDRGPAAVLDRIEK